MPGCSAVDAVFVVARTVLRVADGDGSVVAAETGNVGKVHIRRKGIAGKNLNGLQQDITVCGIGIADIHII